MKEQGLHSRIEGLDNVAHVYYQGGGGWDAEKGGGPLMLEVNASFLLKTTVASRRVIMRIVSC